MPRFQREFPTHRQPLVNQPVNEHGCRDLIVRKRLPSILRHFLAEEIRFLRPPRAGPMQTGTYRSRRFEPGLSTVGWLSACHASKGEEEPSADKFGFGYSAYPTE